MVIAPPAPVVLVDANMASGPLSCISEAEAVWKEKLVQPAKQGHDGQTLMARACEGCEQE